jgi:pyrroline-5-carboxylate reductase
MPNTPAQIGRGITVWYATPEVTELQCEQARILLRALGTDLQVEDERFVEMATAVSGTGPAYVFLVMEALIDAAVHLGFPRHIAHDLVIETLEGSTAFAKATAQHPAVLRNMVTSPGGTSAAAIHELESGRLRTVLSEAVWASYRRTVELGADLEKDLGLNEGQAQGSAERPSGNGAAGNAPAGNGAAGNTPAGNGAAGNGSRSGASTVRRSGR